MLVCGADPDQLLLDSVHIVRVGRLGPGGARTNEMGHVAGAVHELAPDGKSRAGVPSAMIVVTRPQPVKQEEGTAVVGSGSLFHAGGLPVV